MQELKKPPQEIVHYIIMGICQCQMSHSIIKGIIKEIR